MVDSWTGCFLCFLSHWCFLCPWWTRQYWGLGYAGYTQTSTVLVDRSRRKGVALVATLRAKPRTGSPATRTEST
ncbi:hypothetical protein F5884DRAFT_402131 [Xylogone sp. PMI_703]|nr:hypothetical protein F5884DRAFT_402131 [Xylogone sp. PMI_703]